jgi:hypothetical protein
MQHMHVYKLVVTYKVTLIVNIHITDQSTLYKVKRCTVSIEKEKRAGNIQVKSLSSNSLRRRL